MTSLCKVAKVIVECNLIIHVAPVMLRCTVTVRCTCEHSPGLTSCTCMHSSVVEAGANRVVQSCMKPWEQSGCSQCNPIYYLH